MIKAIKKYYELVADRRQLGLAARLYMRIFGLPALGKYFRFRIAKRMIDPLKVKSVLDLGCGQGELSVYLGSQNIPVLSVDISAEPLTDLAEYTKKAKLKIKTEKQNLNNLALKKSYDLVVCLAVLDYLKDRNQFLRTCAEHTNKYFILGVPLANRRVYKPYEEIAHAKTYLTGFDEKILDRQMKKLGFVKLNSKKYLPFNLFYHFSKGTNLLSKFGLGYEKAVSLLYPSFLLITKILNIFSNRTGTEIIILYKKI